MFPNLYILLIGPPGVGKGAALEEIYSFTQAIPDLKRAPDNVSSASLADAMAGATRRILRPTETPAYAEFNSLFAAIDELGVFLKQYENTFMSMLNKFWDGTPYIETKRSMKEELKIERPLLNFLAGTTPGWLGSNLPESAWSEGFSSRLMLIYSGEQVRINPFSEMEFDEDIRARMELDLKDIYQLYGPMKMEESVRDAFLKWHESNYEPRPEHPRLEHYMPRRPVQLMKLAMVFSAIRGNDLVIREEDYEQAMDMFLEAEAYMGDVFRAMRSIGSDSNVIDECYTFVYQIFHKEGKPIAEHRIVQFLAQRIPAHSVAKVLEIMVNSRVLEIVGFGTAPGGKHTYKPAPKAQHGS